MFVVYLLYTPALPTVCAELLPRPLPHPPSCAHICTCAHTYASIHERHKMNILSIHFMPVMHSGIFPVVRTSFVQPHYMCVCHCCLHHMELQAYGRDINPHLLWVWHLQVWVQLCQPAVGACLSLLEPVPQQPISEIGSEELIGDTVWLFLITALCTAL